MWWELYAVSCGAFRADWETGDRKERNPVADKCLPLTSDRPARSPEPFMTEHNWSKSQWNYVHSSIYKKTRRRPSVSYSRIIRKHLEVSSDQCGLLTLCRAEWRPGMITCAQILQYPQDYFIIVLHVTFISLQWLFVSSGGRLVLPRDICGPV